MSIEVGPVSGAKALEGAEIELLSQSGGGHKNAARAFFHTRQRSAPRN